MAKAKGMRTKDAYAPDGTPASTTAMAQPGEHRTLHFDDKQPFILSREPYRIPKVKGKKGPDVLVATLDEAWSEMRTEELGRPVYYFRVYNETKSNEYTTELFEGVHGEPCAVCNCPAAVVCKHILHCCVIVLRDVNPQFGEREKSSEFMTGLKLMPPGAHQDF